MTPVGLDTLKAPPAQPDRRAERRAARRALSRTEILDAAEQVFGEHGLRDGSLRNIAVLSGFSTAAIYLFFENKQHLVSETLARRGDELNRVLHAAAESDLAPIDRLHRIVDDTVAFFAERPHFRRLIRHIRGGEQITGPVLDEYGPAVQERFVESMTTIAGIIRDGQQIGEVRDGNERALGHMFSVLVNEFILFNAAADESSVGTLTSTEFHDLVDGALRNPFRGGR